MTSRRNTMWGYVVWLACAASAVHAQSAAQWQVQQAAAEAKADKIMDEASHQKGLLAQYMTMRQAYASDDSPAFRMIFGQYIGWYLSFLGDYPLATQSFSIAQPAQPDDKPSPLESGYAARPALDAIPDLAKNDQIVLLNEAHNVGMTRSLTVALLSRLYQEGFRYFAAETLSQKDTQLQTRGYPIDDSGFYTEEPVYAEMVRTALKLGYKVIAYEATSNVTSADQREAEQARHLYDSVFKQDPHARLVINAGYEHIVKSGGYLGGQSMAEHLYKLTGASMLAIDQTAMYPHPSSQNNHPYYTAVMKQVHPDVPIVFVDAQDKPWSLRSTYDVTVFFPPEKLERGRPTWLTLWGLRQPHLVSGDGCHDHYACLVEARYSNEGPDAIPADRMLLDVTPMTISISGVEAYSSTQGVPSGTLYLRPGSYQISFIVGGDKVLHRDTITVSPPQP
ncbi:hypothetical protein [Dyella nitratireducens]|uniref:Erythromycin esterase family protein n=1 Tax=Dyella nitratireducens TaxID=1849580 RepID=A0ABQ1G703_9GAMM|nr:hypothetical protein [Dyella nitratireducens]GGA37990.1 hypothetical protein GCM10010981_28930 [Dyella nitratireducens]GLQ40252.1 hypothetical protein GCM10007902_01010 [Dyella nitratireducens]